VADERNDPVHCDALRFCAEIHRVRGDANQDTLGGARTVFI
jgi:hypothetical protein